MALPSAVRPLRKPTSKKGWAAKICVSFALTSLMIGLLPPTLAGRALGTYNLQTGEISVKGNLPDELRRVVLYHEKMHKALYESIPAMKYISSPATYFMAAFFMFLTIMALSQLAFCFFFLLEMVALFPETHAYTLQVLRFGFATDAGLSAMVHFVILGSFVIALVILTRALRGKSERDKLQKEAK